MTAIVGTINRRGVAFAADSAATHTVSSKHKITNHANKIFELSRHNPVGICICGNLDFLGMPWEDIFKLFRKEIGETSCKHLNEYPPLFFEFVKTHVMSHLVDDQILNLRVIINGFFEEIIDISKKELERCIRMSGNVEGYMFLDASSLYPFLQWLRNPDSVLQPCKNKKLLVFRTSTTHGIRLVGNGNICTHLCLYL